MLQYTVRWWCIRANAIGVLRSPWFSSDAFDFLMHLSNLRYTLASRLVIERLPTFRIFVIECFLSRSVILVNGN